MTTPIVPHDLTAAVLLDVRAVAGLLGCSTRHVFRLADEGKMPPRLYVGHLVRWRRADIETWLAAGCPSIKKEEGEQ